MNDLAAACSISDDFARDDLTGLSKETLYQLLQKWSERTAQHFLKLAWIVLELESIGEDLSHVKLGIVHWLRLIGFGQLEPEVLVHFYGRDLLVKNISRLPRPDQAMLAAGGKVQMVVPGSPDTDRWVDPLAMGKSDIDLAFAKNHIRTLAEQAAIIDEKKRRALRPAPEAVGDLIIDKEKGGVWFKRTFISREDLEGAVKFLRD